MYLTYSHLILLVATLFSASSFANKELWDKAYNGEWKPLRKSLKANPQQDLKWVPEDRPSSVRDVLLGARSNIARTNHKLYEALFGENGLIGWRDVGENADVVDNFIVAAKIEEIFKGHHFLDYDRDSVDDYRKVLANTFSHEELEELATIYQDPDFKVLIELCENSPEDAKVPETFELEPSRFLALDPFVSVLKVILIKDGLDATTFNEPDHFAALHPISEMLSDLSNEQIIGLTEKLKSSVYRRELYMRSRFL